MLILNVKITLPVLRGFKLIHGHGLPHRKCSLNVHCAEPGPGRREPSAQSMCACSRSEHGARGASAPRAVTPRSICHRACGFLALSPERGPGSCRTPRAHCFLWVTVPGGGGAGGDVHVSGFVKAEASPPRDGGQRRRFRPPRPSGQASLVPASGLSRVSLSICSLLSGCRV